MRFAEVAVDAPAGYDRTFSYSIPPSLNIEPGHLVKVPFGRRTLQGVIFSLAPAPQVAQTRDILALSNPDPVLTETQRRLARWISQYYMCSLFEAVSPMLPPGGLPRSRVYVEPGRKLAELSLTPFQRKVMDYVLSKGAVDQERLVRAMGQQARATLRTLEDKGAVVRSMSWRRPVGPKYVDHARLTSAGQRAIEDQPSNFRSRAPRRAALLARLSEDETPLPLPEARKEFGAGAVAALMAKGWIERDRVPVERNPLANRIFAPPTPITLTAAQASALAEIRHALRENAPRAFLLHGVTGSGKTEVYLDAVEHCIRMGKRALVLTPEIALTHQTIERFGARFEGKVTVLHSGLSGGERLDQWWKIKRGEYCAVIGSRGAIFAPQPDLGLVVMDEEHEWTYKQSDAAPRYHARDVAMRLSELTGAVVVLGGASPDLASYRRALRGQLRLLTLPGRVSNRSVGTTRMGMDVPLASVEVVDMKRELREGNRGIFSRSLLDSIDRCLTSGNQAILFLNRRGSGSYAQCRSCGASLKCRRCEVGLTYHRGASRLVCHYCGLRRTPPSKCPRCLSYRMSYYGVGTESVAAEASERFPAAKILRLDRDSAANLSTQEQILTDFGAGRAQILVGTQMIAKGLHFPGVSLVGVVSADVGLNMPDYRAGERVFQLLCQVAGRAGRGSVGGKVIVQTYQPDNYSIQAAASQDYRRFYDQELAFRREHANPPFSKLIRLLYQHANRAACEREALRLAKTLEEKRTEWGMSDVDLVGPAPAYPTRVRGRYRWQLFLRGPEPRMLLDGAAVPTGWAIDVDPVSLT